jgi:anaerobic selenocysteine-containing dehydrogenase
MQYSIEIEDGELIMLNNALPQYTHTQFRDVYKNIPCIAWVNPHDAERHSLIDGGKHLICNEHGELMVTVKVTNKVQPGVIWTPRELIDENDNIQNSLTPGTSQKIGGGPIFNTVRIRFKALNPTRDRG